MKLMDAIKKTGGRITVPNCSRDDLPQFFKELGFKVGAEIGVYKGEFTQRFCEAGLKMYAIDPWIVSEDYKHPKGQKRLDFIYEHTRRVLAPYNCTIIRKTSMEAVKDFADESLDFVYIDGLHTFKYIAEDLYEWTKRVRKGGIVSGHDYCIVFKSTWAPCHVKYVLNAFVASYHINDWYILGRVKPREEEIRDRYRSWMFIKK